MATHEDIEAEVRELLKEVDDLELSKVNVRPEVQRVRIEGVDLLQIKGEKGDPGKSGKDGLTGPRGERGPQGPEGKPGKDGAAGKDGESGVQGEIGPVGPQGIPGKDGSPDTPDQVVEKLNQSSKKIKPSQIEGLTDLDRIVKNNNFDVRIGVSKTELTALTTRVRTLETNPTGSFSGAMIPTGTVDGVNKVFVFSSAPSVIVVDEGKQMVATSKNGNVNWTGTTTVTLQVAPTLDIFGF